MWEWVKLTKVHRQVNMFTCGCAEHSVRVWVFHQYASVSCKCAKTSELAITKSNVLWRFHLHYADIVRCMSEQRKDENMLCQCAKQSVQGE